MKVTNKPDFPVTDAACKKETGKTLKQWFKELDKIDGLEKEGGNVQTISTRSMAIRGGQ